VSKYYNSMTQIINKTKTPSNFKLSGPAKISCKDRCAFSIPAGPEFSCPGATKACSKCYAMQKRHLWSPVQTLMANNWKLLKKFEQNNQGDQAASAILKQLRNGPGNFRIFESGDFNSQWAVDMWAKVVRSRKDINFWAYTRSFHLNFTNLTRNPNFVLWASTDKYNTNKARQFVRRFRKSGTKHAYGPWKHDEALPDNSTVCPVTNHKMDMTGACEKCKLCVTKRRINKHIVFLEH